MSVVCGPRTGASKLAIVKDKTLGALLSGNGLDGKLDLVAQYNWGTQDKAAINRALFELVGCQSIDENNPLNSVLDPGRGTGGAILKPEPWTPPAVAFGKVHTIKVQKRLPATAVAITKLPALFNPEKENCPVSYRLEGHASRATTRDFEVHATGYYAEVKDREGAGTRTVEKPSGTVTIAKLDETHIVRNSEPGTSGVVNYTWDGKSQAAVGVLAAPLKITSVCAPYFVFVRYYKDPADKTAFIRMEPFYPRWNLSPQAKWELDETSLVVKWKVEGENSSKAKLKNGQILVYEGDTVVFSAPLTKDQILGGADGSSYDLLKATIHWDKTKVDLKKLPYRIQIQAHSDCDEDNGLALAVMPTQVPPYNYEQVQFIGFNIRNDTNAAGTEYLGNDSDAVDIEFRCKTMVQAIQLAQPHASTDRKVLKVFVAPEFYFRGKKGAYDFTNISTIVPRLRKETDKYEYLDWLFVFGTALGSHEHGTAANPTAHGVAYHYLKILSVDSPTEITAKVWSDPKQGWTLKMRAGPAKIIAAPPGPKEPKDPVDGGSRVKITLNSTGGLFPTTDKRQAWVVERTMTILEAVAPYPTKRIKVANALCGRIPVEPVTNKVVTIGGAYWEAESGGERRKITHVKFFRQQDYYLLMLDAPAPFQTGRPLTLHEPPAVEIINTALMQKGWHAPHLNDGSLRQVVTYKEDFSHIDYIRDENLDFYDKTGKDRRIRLNYVDDVSVLPTEGSKDIGGASPNVTRRPNSAVGSEINKSGLGGGCVIMIDRVSFAMEVCRDHCVHRLYNFYTGRNVRAGDPRAQVHLIPSWGMSIGLCDEGKEVSALRNGLVFNVDGSRMESVARVYDTTYSCDDHIFVTSVIPGDCTEHVTVMSGGTLFYRCNDCPDGSDYYSGAPCPTHGPAVCNKTLQQMGTALHSGGPINVPLSSDANYFHKQGTVEVFPAKPLPAIAVVVPPTLDAIANASAKPGFTVNVTLTGTRLDDTRFIHVESGAINVKSFFVVSDTEVDAEFSVNTNAAVGPHNIRVATFDGQTNAMVFQVLPPAPPTLVSVTPDEGEVHYFHDITLAGTNLLSVHTIESSEPDVVISEVVATADDHIDLKIDVRNAAPPGTCTITVTSAGGTASIDFTVKARPLPVVISVTPDVYRQGTDPAGIVVTGTNIVAQSITLDDSDWSISNLAVISDSEVHFDLSIDDTGAIGPRDLILSTLSGDSAPYSVTVDPLEAPDIVDIDPPSCQQGMWEDVSITGSYLLTPLDVTVSGAGVTVNSFESPSDTQIDAQIEFDETVPPGNRVVTVTTAGGSDDITFAVTARVPPTLTSVDPDSASPGTVQILILGSDVANFKSLDFSGTGITVKSIDRKANDGVQATLLIAATAPPGDRNLTVTNHGGASNALVFTVV